jgi:hypothetical protein
MPPDMLANLKPEFVAPFVAAVTHPDGPDASGKIYEVGAGYVAEIRWERSKGHVFKTDESFTPSAVRIFSLSNCEPLSKLEVRLPVPGIRLPISRAPISEYHANRSPC